MLAAGHLQDVAKDQFTLSPRIRRTDELIGCFEQSFDDGELVAGSFVAAEFQLERLWYERQSGRT